ncbi:cytochrome P450 [Nocardia thraciensis]
MTSVDASGSRPVAGFRSTLRGLSSLRAFSSDPYAAMQRLYQDNGAISVLGAGPMRFRLTLGPEVNEFILANSQLFSWERAFAGLVPLAGPAALLANDGDRHRRLRRLVAPAFTVRRVGDHIETVTRHVRQAVAEWQPGDVVEAYEPLRRALRRATLESLFGSTAIERSDGLDARLHDIHRAVDAGLVRGKIQRWGLPTWRRALAARAEVHRWVVAEIHRRGEHPGPGRDVLGALLEGADGTRLSDEEITDQLVSLLEAGAETTAAQLAWLLHCASRERPIWTDITAAITDRLPGSTPPAPADLDHVTGLDHLVSEAIRLYPATAVVSRMTATEFSLAGQQFVPGDLLILSPYHTHRLASIWPDPDRFDPSRWDPASADYHRPAPHEFLPFGGGPHRCIGANFATMAVKTAFVAVAGHVDCEPVAVDVRPTGLIGMRPAGGLNLRIIGKR